MDIDAVQESELFRSADVYGYLKKSITSELKNARALTCKIKKIDCKATQNEDHRSSILT